MITTISFINILQHTVAECFSLVPRIFKIYVLSNCQIYNIVNYSYRAMHYIPRNYLPYNWKFVPFDSLHSFCPPPYPTAPCFGNHQSL